MRLLREACFSNWIQGKEMRFVSVIIMRARGHVLGSWRVRGWESDRRFGLATTPSAPSCIHDELYHHRCQLCAYHESLPYHSEVRAIVAVGV